MSADPGSRHADIFQRWQAGLLRADDRIRILHVRRRIVIGTAVVVAVGVLALILQTRDSVKHQDSIEYHIREYRKVSGRETFWDEIGDTIRKTVLRGRRGGRRGRMREHRAALTRLGHLEERTFMVTNTTPGNFAAAVHSLVIKKETNLEFFTVTTTSPNTNVVKVVGVKGTIPMYEELLIEMMRTNRLNADSER